MKKESHPFLILTGILCTQRMASSPLLFNIHIRSTSTSSAIILVFRVGYVG